MAKAEGNTNRFRLARTRQFLNLVEPIRARQQRLSILDVGGTVDFWRSVPALYGDPQVEITVVNIDGEARQEENISSRIGDACALDFPDRSFDIVHSNSVIEHVGHWQQISRMAAEIRRVSSNYFVQTPNIWFPIEPHFKLPFVHWLPEQARMALLARMGKAPRDPAGATLAVQRISLLSAGQMQCLFPDARLWRERWVGFTKSLVAIKSDAAPAR